jgi:hypothetical protein
VQGMNDLVSPFFVVFLAPALGEGEDAELLETLDGLGEATRAEVEADCYWCFSKLLEGIHDNFIASQPGIQKRIHALKELVGRIDAPLNEHLNSLCVEYLVFSFRWMNCLLMREIPMKCTIRLWDTYHAEPEGFANFHLFVCAAFLATWSKQILAHTEFQDVIMMLQNPPTEKWSEQEIALLLAEAYRWKIVFSDAVGRLA